MTFRMNVQVPRLRETSLEICRLGKLDGIEPRVQNLPGKRIDGKLSAQQSMQSRNLSWDEEDDLKYNYSKDVATEKLSISQAARKRVGAFR